MAGRPFEGTTINMGAILSTVPPEVFNNSFITIFIVLIIHSFMLAITIRTLQGSHILITLLYFVSFVWIVAITATATGTLLGGLLAA
jgi:flagellar protein FlaJ